MQVSFVFFYIFFPSASNSACAMLLNKLMCRIRRSFGDFLSLNGIFFKKNFLFQNANEAFYYSLDIIWITGGRAFPSASVQLHISVPKSPALAVLTSPQ